MATTRTMTIEELAQLPEDQGRYELLDGELIARPLASGLHAATLTNVVLYVGGHVRRHELGVALAGGAGFVLTRAPDTLLCPDFAFVEGHQRIRQRQAGPYVERSPDLVIEIIDREDLYWIVEEKITHYLAAGVSSVWLMDPRAMRITVCDASGTRRWFVGEEVVSGEPIIPGLRLQTAELFTW